MQQGNFLPRLNISWFDVIAFALFMLGGLFYLDNLQHWSIGYIGSAPYGDAQFWWDGAVHLSHGIFQDNPGKGYRPGYFILMGLILPVLGEQFSQIYFYLLVTFLLVSCAFYLALSRVLGKWPAICITLLLVFNPYTAEWLATSTTDAVGLLLNLAALSCLLFGIQGELKKSWLIGFGLLFSFATLTRPLMTPFIGFVILALLFFAKESFKKKTSIIFLLLFSFCLPTLAWMSIQKAVIDSWAVSSNSAGAFYAASDPNIQVWNNQMYDHIRQLASVSNHVGLDKVTDPMLNSMFEQETFKNYLKYSKYHLIRVVPNLLAVAHFSPSMATHGTIFWQKFALCLLAAGLAFWLLLEGLYFRALVLASMGVVLGLFDGLMPGMILLGMSLALLKPHNNSVRLPMFLLSTYWITGAVALYLVGGAWGTPSLSASSVQLNALGYRLGCQVFFMSDLLAAYVLVWIAFFNSNVRSKVFLLTQRNLLQEQVLKPVPSAINAGIVGSIGIFFFSMLVVYTVGTTIVSHRYYEYTHTPFIPYPSLSAIKQSFQKRFEEKLVYSSSKQGSLNGKIVGEMALPKYAGMNIVFTGSASPFIWNLQGQQRAQLMVHPQSLEKSLSMGPGFIILQVPGQVNTKNWVNVQGAFIVQNIYDKHNILGNQPYYLTVPEVRAFIPLASDGHSFDLGKIIWFPLVKNATQLETNGELKIQNATVTWSEDSGNEKFQRRFFVAPKIQEKTPGEIQLTLDVSSVRGPATLSFGYVCGTATGMTNISSAAASPKVEFFSFNNESNKYQKLSVNQGLISASKNDKDLNKINISIPPHARSIKIIINNLAVGTGVWFYEFNLSASDFARREIKTDLVQRAN